jgi:hypothetical protein
MLKLAEVEHMFTKLHGNHDQMLRSGYLSVGADCQLKFSRWKTR